jgi:excinuclease ABC subunit A
MLKRITVHGARQHNLKNIDVEIPRNTFTVITGLSGSGKSSLAFDTIYAEGQRRYVETLSPYARQFLDQMERPEVDSIDGLSPAISIEQKTTNRSPRSTVGTITEIYDYLRVLYSSIGVPALPQLRHRNRQTEHRADPAADPRAAGRRAGDDSRAHRARPQRRIQEGTGEARARALCARVSMVCSTFLDEEIPLDRARITPSKSWWTAFLETRQEKRLEASIETAAKLADGPGDRIGGEWRRAAVFAKARVSQLRGERAAIGATVVFFQ